MIGDLRQGGVVAANLNVPNCQRPIARLRPAKGARVREKSKEMVKFEVHRLRRGRFV